MKILLVSPLPPPVGGIATWTSNLLKYFKSNDEVEIVHLNSAIKYRNITTINFFQRIYSGIKNSADLLGKFKKEILDHKPDLIHITSSASFALLKDFLILRIANKRKTPVIIHFRFGRIPQLEIKKNWEWFLLKKICILSHKTIVIDNNSFQVMRRNGFKNVEYIPNPVTLDLEIVCKEEKLMVRNQDNGNAIFIGHVKESKGIFELFEASLAIPDLKELIIVGPYEEDIKSRLLEIGKTNNSIKYKFLGSLDHSKIIELLGSANLLVLPSYTEGFPNVVLEAMAMGCPVVATTVGAIPEMLQIDNEDEKCGIGIEPKNVKQLKAAIDYLLKDPNQAFIYGQNGVKRIKNFYTFSTIGNNYLRLWKTNSNYSNQGKGNQSDVKSISRVI